MAYKLSADEDLQPAVVRCAREQLDRATAELSEGVNDDPVKAVHAARKSIKKTRSLLRLVRGAMAPEQRRLENASLRQAARRLSGTRDADVLLATLETLSDRFAGQLPASTFDAVRQHVEASYGNHSRAQVDPRAAQELAAVRSRVDEWQLRKSGWKAVETGLLRSYRRGRKAFTRAQTHRSMEDLHSWRKRVKDLWYHERLLAPGGGPAVSGQAKDAHHLADLLGDDHDLSLLRELLERDATEFAVDVDALLALIDHRQEELQTEAIRLGARVYAESPKAFRRRMRRSWCAGRAAAMLAFEQHPAELAAATR